MQSLLYTFRRYSWSVFRAGSSYPTPVFLGWAGLRILSRAGEGGGGAYENYLLCQSLLKSEVVCRTVVARDFFPSN